MSEITLRPWQAECTGKALSWFKKGLDRHFLINAAPGSGKTICASVIAKRMFDADDIDSVIVIAPRVAVVKQWATDFKFVTGRPMLQITGADDQPEEHGIDLCATWAAVQGLLEGFQAICRSRRTLVICDEHHHAAIQAAWGSGADGAFAEAKYVLVLTGTPIRSDGKESVWLAYDDQGAISHPEDGTYNLSYGEAVDLEYCRPITFHRHEGRFSVRLEGGDNITVSGADGVELTPELKRIKGLQQALDYYKLACTPKFQANGGIDTGSYQASMLEWCIFKLNDLRLRMPDAAGLVIAPSIPVAEHMAQLLEDLDGEKPVLVHSQSANADGKISSFRTNKKRWMVSVAMVSEGVDIPRLRVLAYLPTAQTELAFRQAMGRVVRNCGPNDDSRAYVVMPSHRIFEEYAKRVEAEMSPHKRVVADKPSTKVCPDCGNECPVEASSCSICEHEFQKRPARMRVCSACETLNPQTAKECQFCGERFGHEFEISLNEALRVGAIIRGMELDEDEVKEGEQIRDEFRKGVLSSGDDQLVRIIRQLPEESWGRLARLLESSKRTF